MLRSRRNLKQSRVTASTAAAAGAHNSSFVFQGSSRASEAETRLSRGRGDLLMTPVVLLQACMHLCCTCRHHKHGNKPAGEEKSTK